MAMAAMSTKMRPPHKPMSPVVSADRGLLLPITSMLAPGMKLMMANRPPPNTPSRPGQPQSKTAMTVTMMATVFLFMALLILGGPGWAAPLLGLAGGQHAHRPCSAGITDWTDTL